MEWTRLKDPGPTRVPNIDRLVAFKMSSEADVDVDNLFKLYVLLQDLMTQHMVIDETVKEISISEATLDLETLESATTAIINLCQQLEKDLNLNQRKCCCA